MGYLLILPYITEGVGNPTSGGYLLDSEVYNL